MDTRRTFLLGGSTAMSWAAVCGSRISLAAAYDRRPVDFISALGNQAFAVMRGGYSAEQKVAYFQSVLQRDFDIPGAASFVLGPYWRVASVAERAEFTTLLERYIVVTFGLRLAEYGGVSMRVTGTRGTPAYTIVASEVSRSSAPSIRLDWVLAQHGSAYRVDDLVVDGVSMRLGLRNDIAAIAQRGGAGVAGIVMTMRQIIAQSGL
jgi:phospholipid transport system substrate-binding protein